jgi:hypothetical protein
MIMRPSNPFLVSTLSLLTLAASACEAEDQAGPGLTCPVARPLSTEEKPNLAPPPEAKLYLSLYAEGTQVYTCKAGTDGAYAWSFKAPEAKLFDESCAQVGTHFAGPTWQMDGDRSAVVGMKVAEAAAPGAIPWLLLSATPKSPTGMFGPTSFIQRVATTGGLPPTEPCDASNAGRETGIYYTATYLFFRQAP